MSRHISSSFSIHPQMKDRFLGKCKSITKNLQEKLSIEKEEKERSFKELIEGELDNLKQRGMEDRDKVLPAAEDRERKEIDEETKMLESKREIAAREALLVKLRKEMYQNSKVRTYIRTYL